jgi:hypothetical protein
MKRILFSTLLLLVTACTFSQTKQNFIGKWAFQDIYIKDGLVPEQIKNLQGFFADFTFYIKENKHYNLEMMGKKEEGTWEYTAKDSTIILSSTKGKISSAKLLLNSTKNIAIKLDKANFILKRDSITANDEKEEKIIDVKKVSATTEQISKKWFLKTRQIPNKSAEQLKKVNEMFKGTYYNFLKNGVCETYLLKSIVKDKWTFGINNTTILIGEGTDKLIWTISKITATELEMVKGNSEEVWIFSTIL